MSASRQEAWRRVVTQGINNGIGLPAFSGSLAYYDSYRRARLPGNLIQARRDFFGVERGDDKARVCRPSGPFRLGKHPTLAAPAGRASTIGTL